MTDQTHAHKRFPEWLGFILNNPVRRALNPPERLISMLAIQSNDVVVDFGCGPGFYSIPMARVAGKLIAVDVSPKMLERTSKHAAKSNVTIQTLQTDGIKIGLEDESVNLILLTHVFHEVEGKALVLGEVRRILKPSGRLAIVERTRPGGMLSGKMGPPVINQKELVKELMESGFTFTETIPMGRDSIVISRKA